jgi:hypothetical protein
MSNLMAGYIKDVEVKEAKEAARKEDQGPNPELKEAMEKTKKNALVKL